MSAIFQALSKLDHVVDKLENSVNGLESSMAGIQRDMFGVPLAAPSNAKTNGTANGKGIDRAAVAKRLDNAIGKVEKLLVEGGGRGRG